MKLFRKGRKAFEKSSDRPLLMSDDSDSAYDRDTSIIPLYDMLVMTEMASSLCQGYITLLTGTSEQPKDAEEQEEKALPLAFASLTDGNVIDACFGVKVSAPASGIIETLIKEAKTALDDAVDSNENIAKTAVIAYKQAFENIVSTNNKLDQLNIFTRCFLETKIKQKGRKAIETAFEPLENAIRMPF